MCTKHIAEQRRNRDMGRISLLMNSLMHIVSKPIVWLQQLNDDMKSRIFSRAAVEKKESEKDD